MSLISSTLPSRPLKAPNIFRFITYSITPWTVPVTYRYPLTQQPKLGPKGNGGCRVAPAKSIRAALSGQSAHYTPTFADIARIVSSSRAHAHGWRLEHFMGNLLMKCKEGHVFKSAEEDNMFALFSRRSGPIAAALAISVEQFND
jgi:hypothetical protein